MDETIIKRAAGIIIRNEPHATEVLVVQEPSGLFNIPGGGQDPEDNGDIAVTLKREMMEELGLASDQFTYEDTGIVNYFTYKKPTHPRYGMQGEFYAFLVRLKETAEPKVTEEIKSLKWCAFDEAIACIVHDDVVSMLNQVAEKYQLS
jgi:8-oxo-dGTP pyrophosphatase MutT (NUDIX family)